MSKVSTSEFEATPKLVHHFGRRCPPLGCFKVEVVAFSVRAGLVSIWLAE